MFRRGYQTLLVVATLLGVIVGVVLIVRGQAPDFPIGATGNPTMVLTGLIVLAAGLLSGVASLVVAAIAWELRQPPRPDRAS